MNYSFLDFLSLIGAVGLFLYGMKIMSEGLQKTAGDRMRNILSAMTKNRFAGLITGIFITALIQSSSASTVMVVSFVNAGLMSLADSMAVIMGANVGTTFTAWIISIFGGQVNVNAFILPLIGIATPFLFSSKSNYKSIAEFLIGFSFLFLGLQLISENVRIPCPLLLYGLFVGGYFRACRHRHHHDNPIVGSVVCHRDDYVRQGLDNV